VLGANFNNISGLPCSAQIGGGICLPCVMHLILVENRTCAGSSDDCCGEW